MNKILYILRRRPLVQELVSGWAEMESHIDDVSLGTKTQGDHRVLVQEFSTVCHENRLRIKLEKCEFMREEMEYLGFHVGYGWWKPAASNMQPLQDMQIRDDPEEVIHDVCNFCLRVQFLPVPYTQFYIFICPPDCPYNKDQPLAVDRQCGGLFPGVEERNLLYKLPRGALP